MSYLLFVDTNILLDFYRVDSGDATLPLLKHFEGNHRNIITTSEVEMEFKKNRQKIILQSIPAIKINKSELISIPAFLRDSKLDEQVRKTRKRLERQSAILIERAIKILKSPSRYDPVYKTLERLFRSRLSCHLSREKEKRHEIRELAQKRYTLGYPPRKESSLSIIDAINWEWIVYCAKENSNDIVIVSRDKDYGEHYEKDSILNDWLLQEFKDRVSKHRSIILTRRLAQAFELASISVPDEERESEERLIQTRSQFSDIFKYSPSSIIYDPATILGSQDMMSNVLKSLDTATILGSQDMMSNVLKSLDTATILKTQDMISNILKGHIDLPITAIENAATEHDESPDSSPEPDKSEQNT